MTTGASGTAVLSRRQPELGSADACSGAVECALAGAADHVLLLMWLLMLVVIAVGSLHFVPRAQELCAQERDRTEREYESFDRFLDQIFEISTSNPQASAASAGGLTVIQERTPAPGGDLAAVASAYEETVMAVPHFEQDYGETLSEHMAAELGEEVAEGVLGRGTLSDRLKAGIIETARTARDRRENLLGLLEGEAASLDRHASRLGSIHEKIERATTTLCSEQTYDELLEQRAELEECQDTLEEIVETRQADRNDNRITCMPRKTQMHLQEYLYMPMDVTYPVIAESTELLSRVMIASNRVEDELIYRA